MTQDSGAREPDSSTLKRKGAPAAQPGKRKKPAKVPKGASELFNKWQAVRKDLVRPGLLLASAIRIQGVPQPLNFTASQRAVCGSAACGSWHNLVLLAADGVRRSAWRQAQSLLSATRPTPPAPYMRHMQVCCLMQAQFGFTA